MLLDTTFLDWLHACFVCVGGRRPHAQAVEMSVMFQTRREYRQAILRWILERRQEGWWGQALPAGLSQRDRMHDYFALTVSTNTRAPKDGRRRASRKAYSRVQTWTRWSQCCDVGVKMFMHWWFCMVNTRCCIGVDETASTLRNLMCMCTETTINSFGVDSWVWGRRDTVPR